MNVMYMNKANGKYDVSRKISTWFVDKFLESFDTGKCYAQDTRLKPWEYKGLMEIVESNHWKMLTPKQWDVFRRNVVFDMASMEEFANFMTETKKVKISISRITGFVTISIEEI